MRTTKRHGRALELATTLLLLTVVAMGGISRRLTFAAENATMATPRHAPCEIPACPVTPCTNPAHFDGDRQDVKDLLAALASAPTSCDLALDCLAQGDCTALDALPAPTNALLSLQACWVRLQV